MRIAAAAAWVGVVVMSGAIAYGFGWGDFWAEGRALLAMPWGAVSLVDVYVGFFLFAGWILFREGMGLRSCLWILLVLILGNLVSCIYVLRAVAGSAGDWHRFWLGVKHQSLR
jgi:hypothetical protein